MNKVLKLQKLGKNQETMLCANSTDSNYCIWLSLVSVFGCF